MTSPFVDGYRALRHAPQPRDDEPEDEVGHERDAGHGQDPVPHLASIKMMYSPRIKVRKL